MTLHPGDVLLQNCEFMAAAALLLHTIVLKCPSAGGAQERRGGSSAGGRHGTSACRAGRDRGCPQAPRPAGQGTGVCSGSRGRRPGGMWWQVPGAGACSGTCAREPQHVHNCLTTWSRLTRGRDALSLFARRQFRMCFAGHDGVLQCHARSLALPTCTQYQLHIQACKDMPQVMSVPVAPALQARRDFTSPRASCMMPSLPTRCSITPGKPPRRCMLSSCLSM